MTRVDLKLECNLSDVVAQLPGVFGSILPKNQNFQKVKLITF